MAFLLFFSFLQVMLFYPLINVSILVLVLNINVVSGYNQLHIGGIFPINGKGGWQGGQACMPAAKLALQDVNEKEDLLPGFNLTLHSNDSEVSYNKLF